MKVQNIMTSEAGACDPHTNLAAAAMLMWDNDCGVIPVVENDRVVGVITDRDICMATATKHLDPATIETCEVITGEVFSCKPGDDVRTALATMRENRVRRLPVIDDDGKLAGILSMNDVVLRAKAGNGKKGDIPYEDVMSTLRAICGHLLPVADTGEKAKGKGVSA